MDFNLGDQVRRQIEEAFRKRGRVNVVVAGRSGVGKSTLVNAVFQGHLAETGQGRPVTRETHEYSKEGVPVSIFDTRGLEMDRFTETLKQLRELLETRAREDEPTRHLHVAWLCLSEDSRRVEEGESKAMELLSRYMPVMVVITKARSDQGFGAEVERLLPKARHVVRVRALGETDDEGNVLHPSGLVKLVDLTMELVPEGQKNAFAAAQKVSIDQKKSRAHLIVAGTALTAAGIGATPIPFADAALIVPFQIGMLAGISATFGLPLNEAFLSTLISSAMTGLGATLTGQSIVSGLLKLLPGVGSVIGGAIAAGTAAMITTAFGEAYIFVLARLIESKKGEMPTEAEIRAAFSEELRRKKTE